MRSDEFLIPIEKFTTQLRNSERRVIRHDRRMQEAVAGFRKVRFVPKRREVERWRMKQQVRAGFSTSISRPRWIVSTRIVSAIGTSAPFVSPACRDPLFCAHLVAGEGNFRQ